MDRRTGGRRSVDGVRVMNTGEESLLVWLMVHEEETFMTVVSLAKVEGDAGGLTLVLLWLRERKENNGDRHRGL